MFGEMHPPDLKMFSSNTTEGNSRSHVVVMAGRWIMYDNGVFLLLMVYWEET
ncbi:BnaA02g18600D [Brassica napus]|uniref:(rape) hypothetical protein n=1 Tax=Brassica napus TaxID=3708 RepID=A0A078HKG6_BRANA|nr:unnamed protein product [Brassica napus]CDY38367.1 BnaA02g18600D [Brassica napus]